MRYMEKESLNNGLHLAAASLLLCHFGASQFHTLIQSHLFVNFVACYSSPLKITQSVSQQLNNTHFVQLASWELGVWGVKLTYNWKSFTGFGSCGCCWFGSPLTKLSSRPSIPGISCVDIICNSSGESAKAVE